MDLQVSDGSLFSADYETARARFILAAAKAGAAVTTYVHPTLRTARGGSLTCDVAVMGPRDAPKAFVAVAGTHGVEGFMGSAAHLQVLQSGMAVQRAPDCRIVLIHAINPYGFAYGSRTTENNVDLNRNFIDHQQTHPHNAYYPLLHSVVCNPHYDPQTHDEQIQALRAWTREHGADARNQALIAGQYTIPSGRAYGGRSREWSNQVLERIAHDQLRGVQQIAFIDWHTGLGGYGKEFFLCFNDPGSPEYDQCVSWWGRERIESNQGFEGAARPRYQGLLFNGLKQFTAPARFAGAVVEFGILSNEDQEAIFMLDYWLRFGDRTGVSQATVQQLHQRVLDAFTPPDPAWRDSVARRFTAILQDALDGLHRGS